VVSIGREEGTAASTRSTWGWWVAAAALFALRIPHLGGPLDDPHSWRQCDTFFYSLQFHRHGIDLLHPAVAWLGAPRALIFEFPLNEALSAVLYGAFGASPLWDRVVALAFFAAAAAYLFGFVRHVAGSRPAWLATLAYLAFPLGQYYSRAAQVDFTATAFAHALLFHATLAIERRAIGQASIAAACGVLAVLIKAPYVLPILGPLGLAALASPSLATVGLGALALGVPAIAFKVWRRHVDHVNDLVPDWTFLPGFYKEVNPLWWYVGSWSQRLEVASWIKLAKRMIQEVATPLGMVLAAVGLFFRAPSGRRFGPVALALAWSVATAIYLTVFFPLNVIHSYYQIPFLAPAAMLVGLGGELLWQRLPRLSRVPAGAIVYAIFLALSCWMVRPLGYYRIDWLRIEAGKMIDRRVPRGDLIVVADHSSGYSDPRLLVRADRTGWPLAMSDLDPPRLQRLAALGARWVAVINDPEHADLAPPAFLAPSLVAREAIRHGEHAMGTLSVYRLDPAAGTASAASAPVTERSR